MNSAEFVNGCGKKTYGSASGFPRFPLSLWLSAKCAGLGFLNRNQVFLPPKSGIS
jgi:hypothetical protein